MFFFKLDRCLGKFCSVDTCVSQSVLSIKCFFPCSKVYCAGWLAAKNEGLTPQEAKVSGMDARRKCLGIEPFLFGFADLLETSCHWNLCRNLSYLRWIIDHGPRDHPTVGKYLVQFGVM